MGAGEGAGAGVGAGEGAEVGADLVSPFWLEKERGGGAGVARTKPFDCVPARWAVADPLVVGGEVGGCAVGGCAVGGCAVGGVGGSGLEGGV